MDRLTILGGADCQLCRDALAVARALQKEYAFDLEYKDLEHEPQLRSRYGQQIPVVLLNDEELCWGQVSADRLRDALRGARRSRSISRILSRLGFKPKR